MWPGLVGLALVNYSANRVYALRCDLVPSLPWFTWTMSTGKGEKGRWVAVTAVWGLRAEVSRGHWAERRGVGADGIKCYRVGGVVLVHLRPFDRERAERERERERATEAGERCRAPVAARRGARQGRRAPAEQVLASGEGESRA